jgi:hypothetical protein
MERAHRITSACALFCLAASLAACSRFQGPATFEEAVKLAGDAVAAQDWPKVRVLCDRAAELADKAGDGNRVMLATDCAAEAATREGKPEQAFARQARLYDAYEGQTQTYGGRHRMRNNYAVALIEKGKRDEGIAVLLKGLNAYEGTPYHITTWNTHAEYMAMVRNLAIAHAGAPSTPAVKAWTEENAEWIAGRLKAEHVASGMSFQRGSGAALAALAVLAERDGVAAAGEWRRLGEEWMGHEAQYAATYPTVQPLCKPVQLYQVKMTNCFRELKS